MFSSPDQRSRVILSAAMPADLQSDQLATQRRKMVDVQLRARGLADERVLQAMARVPRHEFVAPCYRDQAYEDHPLPIGENQTISQPYIVGLTLEALGLYPSHRVLEIGTGTGYQTALLAELAQHVYSIERHPDLARQAEATLAGLGYTNTTVIAGDGSIGLLAMAPFDAIAVSAAAPRIPTALFDQLREGGRLVLPVGPAQGQELQLVRKEGGQAIVRDLGACSFVPLIGGQGYLTGW
jgi:protein-L-isoaspartate(D-aspartate) O-methyltransferase